MISWLFVNLNVKLSGNLSRHVCVQWEELVTELRASNVFIMVWSHYWVWLGVRKKEANWPFLWFLVCLCFHILEIFRAPVPIHKSGEMRQEYEKQKMKVSYWGVTLIVCTLYCRCSWHYFLPTLRKKKYSFTAFLDIYHAIYSGVLINTLILTFDKITIVPTKWKSPQTKCKGLLISNNLVLLVLHEIQF